METIKNDTGYICATAYIKAFNKENRCKRVIAEFLSNQSTVNLLYSLQEKHGIKDVYIAKRGVGGNTFMHEELFTYFHNWLHKIPNKSFGRDEYEFCTAIEASFEGVLTFERQMRFGLYFVDLYCNELKLCIEYDELHHRDKNDMVRQNKIESEYGVSFYRHSKKDNIYVGINHILRLVSFAQLYS